MFWELRKLNTLTKYNANKIKGVYHSTVIIHSRFRHYRRLQLSQFFARITSTRVSHCFPNILGLTGSPFKKLALGVSRTRPFLNGFISVRFYFVKKKKLIKMNLLSHCSGPVKIQQKQMAVTEGFPSILKKSLSRNQNVCWKFTKLQQQ